MTDTSQLLTNEPFTNENNTNKFILNFLGLIVLLKR